MRKQFRNFTCNRHWSRKMGPIWHLMDNFGAQVPFRLKQPAASSDNKKHGAQCERWCYGDVGDFSPDNLQLSPIFVWKVGTMTSFLFPMCTSFCWVSFLRIGKSDMIACLLKNRWCVLDALLLVVSMLPFLIRCFMKPTSPLKSAAGTSSFFLPKKTLMF